MMARTKKPRPDELRLIRAGGCIGGFVRPSLQGHTDTQGEARRSVRSSLSVEYNIFAGGIAHRADPDATSEAPEIKPYHSRAVEA